MHNFSAKLGEDIVIEVKDEDPISNFVYIVMVRGKILKHEYVKVQGGEKSVCIKIRVTFEMAKSVKIYAILIKDGKVKYNELTIHLPITFPNRVIIEM